MGEVGYNLRRGGAQRCGMEAVARWEVREAESVWVLVWYRGDEKQRVFSTSDGSAAWGVPNFCDGPLSAGIGAAEIHYCTAVCVCLRSETVRLPLHLARHTLQYVLRRVYTNDSKFVHFVWAIARGGCLRGSGERADELNN